MFRPKCSIFGFAAIVLFCFVALTTYGTFRLFDAEPYGVFYDYQARSLLAARLDVPEEAIGGEAFIRDGKYYGYFGPTPALLRVPFAALGTAPGTLSRSFMLAYLIAALIAAYLVLRDIYRREYAGAPPTFTVLLLVANASLGSTLLFLGGRAMMYHEAIMAGAALALWSAWCSLRFACDRRRRWWLGALAFAVLSLHARPPTGLFALTLLGLIALHHACRPHNEESNDATAGPGRSPRWRSLGICGAVALAAVSLNGVAYLKFRTFDPAPLHLSRPYSPARLAHIDGKSFHAANLPYGAYWYLVRPNIRFESHFPYLFIHAQSPARDFPRAKVDLYDYVLGLPYAMPGLTVLALAGLVAALTRKPRWRATILVTWVAAAPMTVALFAAVAIAQRYTADFCPFLIVAAAFGLVAIAGYGVLARRVLVIVAIMATGAAVYVNLALTLDYQAHWAPNLSPDIQSRYQRAFRQIDGMLGTPD